MICLIPVSRFRVAYETAAGRPFSDLERMVLRAIREGVTGLEEMQALFQIHQRILIEALVTLTQAGWVALASSGGGFLLTSEGVQATEHAGQPSTTAVFRKQTYVLLERLTGGLILKEDAQYVSGRQLQEPEWAAYMRLRATFHDNAVDEGQVRKLLPRRQGEWVRWIGPIEMTSKDADWVPVDVQTNSGTVEGLPEPWHRRLAAVILEEAERRCDEVEAGGRPPRWDVGGSGIAGTRRVVGRERGSPRREGVSVNVTEEDLIVGEHEHVRALTAALGTAKSSVFVASAFLSGAAVAGLTDPLLDAARRGLRVDLLWGYSTSQEDRQPALEAIRR